MIKKIIVLIMVSFMVNSQLDAAGAFAGTLDQSNINTTGSDDAPLTAGQSNEEIQNKLNTINNTLTTVLTNLNNNQPFTGTSSQGTGAGLNSFSTFPTQP